jgi:two-component system phosphate regulon sensor histidine kinase PhoR
MGFIVVVHQWLVPHGWLLESAMVLGWASVSAYLLARSVRRSIAPLQVSAHAIANRPSAVPALPLEQRYRDFQGLARSIAAAAAEVDRALGRASASRRELEAIVDSMEDAVVAVDAAGRIQWTNQRMQHLLPKSVSGASISSPVRIGHMLVQTIRDPDVLNCVGIALADRTLSQTRSIFLYPGRIYEINASPVPGGGAVAVIRDITRIEHMERTQRDFVANVSHELRTPLTSITGYVETLIDHEAGISSLARDFLETILKNATRMNRLTEDLLLMSRVESSEQQLQPLPVPADTLIRDAVEAMTGLVLDVQAALEVGETTQAHVLADTDAVVQVLSSLIENGIKYGTRTGSSPARVTVSAREVHDPLPAVEFSVRDFGSGIASEHLTRIFERFYRVDKARSRESGGTGLGLAIARHIIQAQGGTIWAESDLNQGSNFLFTLPLAQGEVS